MASPPAADDDAENAARRIRVLNDADEPLADLLVGKSAGRSAAVLSTAASGELVDLLYVRRPMQEQTWLAAGRLDPPSELADWLRLAGPDVKRDDIAKLSVTPAEGPAYSAARDEAGETPFAVSGIPEGRSLRAQTAANTAAYALVNLNFTDVRPPAELTEEPAAKVDYTLFDGAEIFVKLYEDGEDRWAVFEAAGGPSAEALAKQLGGWAYQLSAYQFDRLAPPLEDLLAAENEDAEGEDETSEFHEPPAAEDVVEAPHLDASGAEEAHDAHDVHGSASAAEELLKDSLEPEAETAGEEPMEPPAP